MLDAKFSCWLLLSCIFFPPSTSSSPRRRRRHGFYVCNFFLFENRYNSAINEPYIRIPYWMIFKLKARMSIFKRDEKKVCCCMFSIRKRAFVQFSYLRSVKNTHSIKICQKTEIWTSIRFIQFHLIWIIWWCVQKIVRLL